MTIQDEFAEFFAARQREIEAERERQTQEARRHETAVHEFMTSLFNNNEGDSK